MPPHIQQRTKNNQNNRRANLLSGSFFIKRILIKTYRNLRQQNNKKYIKDNKNAYDVNISRVKYAAVGKAITNECPCNI
jgi:hypothetical protein